MRLNRTAAAALISLALASTGYAQNSVDVSRLPVNLTRIQRELRQSTVRDESHGLRIRYQVDVYGTAPPIDLFNRTDPNLFTGPVPYGAPTHREFIEQVTPREYRAPAADFSALIRWFAEKAAQKSQR
jgi:hypothetical protein